MKHFYLLFAVICSIPLFAQEPALQKDPGGPVEITEVILLDSFPAAQLFFNAKLFLSNASNRIKEASSSRNEKARSIGAKVSFPVIITTGRGGEINANVDFIIGLQCKESQYSYTLTDFYFAYTEETGITSYAAFKDRIGVLMTPKQWRQVEAQSEVFISAFVSRLKEQMLQTELLCKEVLAANKKRK
jgi:hypothetical protein